MSEAARAAFARDGYYGPIRVLSEAEAAACRSRLEALIAAHPAARLDQKSHLLAPWLDRVVRHPAMLCAWGQVLNVELYQPTTSRDHIPPKLSSKLD